MPPWKAIDPTGAELDLHDDLHFYPRAVAGASSPPITVFGTPFAGLPGETRDGERHEARTITMTGRLKGQGRAQLNARKVALLDVFKPDRVPRSGYNSRPVVLRYEGSERDLNIGVKLQGEYTQVTTSDNECTHAEMTLQLRAQENPFWYSAEERLALGMPNTLAVQRLAARIDGEWSNLGGAAINGVVYAIAEDDDYIYVGGAFTNLDGDPNADYIARYHKNTGVWSPLGTGMNGLVRAIAIGPDGRLYAGGAFTTAGGGAALRIAVWDGAAWAALGAGMDAGVQAIAIGLDGRVYAGGVFTTAGGGAALRIAMWDGAAWAVLGAGMDAGVQAIAIGLDGRVYAGGQFTTAGGGAASRIAVWNGTAWAALGAGINGSVAALAIAPDGRCYAGGDFSLAGGVDAYNIAVWNGIAWSPLDTGTNDFVRALDIAPDGVLYAVGDFTAAGKIEFTQCAAKWNGYTWAHIDINLPGVPTVGAVYASRYLINPDLPSNHNLWLGFASIGNADIPSPTLVVNPANVETFPIINVTGPGYLLMIRNETNGQEMDFQLWINTGETITINLSPGIKTVVSNWLGRPSQGRGETPSTRILGQPLAGSIFSQWRLETGDNDISLWMIDVAAGTGAEIHWTPLYYGYESGDVP